MKAAHSPRIQAKQGCELRKRAPTPDLVPKPSAPPLLSVLQSEFSKGHVLVAELLDGLYDGVVVWLGAWLVSSASWAATLACAQLRRRGGTPMRLLRFLDDARERKILRTVGPVYQFRHARLQDRLAHLYEDTLPVQKIRKSWTARPTRPAPNGVTGGLDASEVGLGACGQGHACATTKPNTTFGQPSHAADSGLTSPWERWECGSGIEPIPEPHSQE